MLTELLKFMLPVNNVYGTQRPVNILNSALSTTNFLFSVFDTIVARQSFMTVEIRTPSM